jgi:hypothetical protein
MRKSDAWIVVIATGTGLWLGFGGTRLYDFFHRPDPGVFSHEFIIHAKHDVDWRHGIGDDVVVEFRSFVTRKGKKVREGPSLEWSPIPGDRRVEFYRDGSVDSVESKQINVD